MDLRKRLANLDRLTRKTGVPGDGCVRQPADLAWLTDLGLSVTDTPDGPVYWRQYTDSLAWPGSELPTFHGFFTHALAARPTLEELLWLDTETTGLAGGTGTLAFVVGVSWWRGGCLTTRQYFLPGPETEAAMLAQLKMVAAGFKVVLTFNGASFDLPLLRTRALLNRGDDPCAHLVGWDLLVPARRVFGRRLPDCRQQTLEGMICRLDRAEGDIDGAQIPATWFEFLASGQIGRLADVLRHNRRDMVGMAHIFRAVWQHAELTPAGNTELTVDWLTGWSLGRICEKTFRREQAIAWLTAAVRDPKLAQEQGWQRGAFVADALRVLKRSGDWTLVQEIVTRAVAAGLTDPWLHREAAILYEHRLICLERALAHARLCGEGKRVARLVRKLAKQGA